MGRDTDNTIVVSFNNRAFNHDSRYRDCNLRPCGLINPDGNFIQFQSHSTRLWSVTNFDYPDKFEFPPIVLMRNVHEEGSRGFGPKYIIVVGEYEAPHYEKGFVSLPGQEIYLQYKNKIIRYRVFDPNNEYWNIVGVYEMNYGNEPLFPRYEHARVEKIRETESLKERLIKEFIG